MIRLINCIKKRTDISQQEFRTYWNSREFDALREAIATESGAVKSSKALTLQVEANITLRKEKGSAEPFDGTVEYFWNDGASLMGFYATEEFQKMVGEMNAYQAQFVDVGNSASFFTEV